MRTLILVDLQNDFMPGGSMAVKDGHQVVPIANEIQSKFDFVVATQDWHPANHGSFATNHFNKQVGDIVKLNGLDQILWPTHCVVDTKGSELVSGLKTHNVACIFRKGMSVGVDSYSAFFDNGRVNSTGLNKILERKTTQVYVMGLATDYCVKYTVLDACSLFSNIFLIEDGCRGVELNSGDIEKAKDEMIRVGAKIILSKDIGARS